MKPSAYEALEDAQFKAQRNIDFLSALRAVDPESTDLPAAEAAAKEAIEDVRLRTAAIKVVQAVLLD